MSFIASVRRSFTARSYGICGALVQASMLLAGLGAISGQQAAAAERPLRIVVLGDSLTAGLGLPAPATFPARLAAALKAKGRTVEVVNAGVSGDTAAAGLARLDWAVPDGTDGVIVELGANDMLRGLPPHVTRDAIEGILRRLAERRIPVLLAGMRGLPNMGADYAGQFEAIYPELAAQYDTVFYPFFLQGVAADATLNQSDGIHPSAAGVERIVAGILPKVEELMIRIAQKQGP
jgi:acyl-CoA thioesterase-1